MTQADIKQVVVCADDYALNAPVSQGIVALAVLGRLSATSVMTLSPRWAEDAVALRDVRERLDVGVHLDWTSRFAMDAGHGHGLNVVMARAMLHLYRAQAVQDEIERQLDAFEAHWQAVPDHIDGHQHIQQFAVLRDALAHVRSQCEGNVLVVSSGGPISTAVGSLLGTPPESMIEMNMRIRNTAVSECVYNPKRTTLVSFNTINHLDADAYRDWVTFT